MNLTASNNILLELLSFYSCHPAISFLPNGWNNSCVCVYVSDHATCKHLALRTTKNTFFMAYMVSYDLTPMSLRISFYFSCLEFVLPNSENSFDRSRSFLATITLNNVCDLSLFQLFPNLD